MRLGFLESIQQNTITAMLFYFVFMISIMMSKIYQKKRITYNELGEITVRKMNGVRSFFWTIGIIFLPALLIGFRHYEVGSDTINLVVNYSRIASNQGNVILSDRLLYSLIRYIVFLVSNGNPTFFLLSFSFSTLYILIRALDKWIDKVSLPLALFVYYTLFGMQLLNQSRQLLAISILLYALPFLLNRKYTKYYIFVFIACLIHFTAVTGILFHALYFKKSYYGPIKKITYNIVWLLSPMLIYPVLTFLNNIIPSSYGVYIDNVSYSGIGFGLLLTIFPVITPIILYQKYLKTNESRFMVRIAMLTYPLRYAGYYSYFLMRLNYFSSVFMVILIPLMISKLDSRSRRIKGKIVIITILLIYYIVHYMYLDAGEIFPYKSVF